MIVISPHVPTVSPARTFKSRLARDNPRSSAVRTVSAKTVVSPPPPWLAMGSRMVRPTPASGTSGTGGAAVLLALLRLLSEHTETQGVRLAASPTRLMCCQTDALVFCVMVDKQGRGEVLRGSGHPNFCPVLTVNPISLH